MKNITLEIVSRNHAEVQFRVKNTHRGEAFGKDGSVFEASNGITVRSYAYVSTNVLFVQGDTPNYDNKVCKCSPEFFLKIETAVKEYNDYFAEKKPMKTQKPRLKIEEIKFNSTLDKAGTFLRINKTTNPNLRAFKIVECSGFDKEQECTFNGWTFRSLYYVNAPTQNRKNSIDVWGIGNDKNAIILVTTEEFNQIKEAIRLMNIEADKPDFIKEVTFVYKNGGSSSRRYLKVVKEDDTHIEGIDADKSEFRKFLKSEIVGEIKEIK